MTRYPMTTVKSRSIGKRGRLMVLMGLAFQITATLLLLVAITQFVISVVGGEPNARLRTLGTSLGRYLGQIASFESFATEDPPFPFADWPRER